LAHVGGGADLARCVRSGQPHARCETRERKAVAAQAEVSRPGPA